MESSKLGSVVKTLRSQAEVQLEQIEDQEVAEQQLSATEVVLAVINRAK
jgi:hypothetical protein